ncbi:MAG: sugar porter family MFS transporter, partial [Dehalococcoidia bacterium]
MAVGSDGSAPLSARHEAGRQALLFSLIAALGGFLFGFATAVINGAVGAIRAHFDASSLAIGLAVASTLIGGAVGAWFA